MHVVVAEQRRIAHDTSWHTALDDDGEPIEQRIAATWFGAGSARWEAEVRLPRRPLHRYRITIRELEHHLADAGTLW